VVPGPGKSGVGTAQIAAGVTDYNSLPSRNESPWGFSWGVYLLPFIEQSAVYEQVSFDLPVLALPAWTDANVNEDLFTILENSTLTASQAFWMGTGHYSALSSAYYRPNKCDKQTPQADLDGCVGNFSSWHPGGLNVVLMDGSVRFISENIDSAEEADIDAIPCMTGSGRRDVYGIWQALCDINDGKVIGEF